MDIFTDDDLEVDISPESEKAIIKGKTAVPFKTLVKLILQRKVTVLFEKWGKDPIVINSELLTDLASSPQDNLESSRHLVAVTFGCGIFMGLFAFALLQLILVMGNITLTQSDLLYVLASMACVAIVGWVIMRMQLRNRSDKLLETMERIASIVPKK